MKAALVSRGHHVVLSAPDGEQSGSSAAINLDALSITKERDDDGAAEFSVALASGGRAEPATSALVGINIATGVFGQPPDLLISGINDGANIGAATQLSGTVGATIASIAAGVGNAQVPAVGISTDEVCDPEAAETPAQEAQCLADIAEHFAQVAAFMGRLIDTLEANSGRSKVFGGLLPLGVGLSVNYPPLAPEHIAGVKLVEQGRDLVIGGSAIFLSFGCFGDCGNLAVGASLPGGINGAGPVLATIRNGLIRSGSSVATSPFSPSRPTTPPHRSTCAAANPSCAGSLSSDASARGVFAAERRNLADQEKADRGLAMQRRLTDEQVKAPDFPDDLKRSYRSTRRGQVRVPAPCPVGRTMRG